MKYIKESFGDFLKEKKANEAVGDSPNQLVVPVIKFREAAELIKDMTIDHFKLGDRGVFTFKTQDDTTQAAAILKDADILAESVNERVIYKRRYTDNYPAKKINSSTKVRNKVLDAIADGKITEDELYKILDELGSNKGWLKRNSKLFKIEEDGIVLSKTGFKMFKALKSLNEAYNEAGINRDVLGTSKNR